MSPEPAVLGREEAAAYTSDRIQILVAEGGQVLKTVSSARLGDDLRARDEEPAELTDPLACHRRNDTEDDFWADNGAGLWSGPPASAQACPRPRFRLYRTRMQAPRNRGAPRSAAFRTGRPVLHRPAAPAGSLPPVSPQAQRPRAAASPRSRSGSGARPRSTARSDQRKAARLRRCDPRPAPFGLRCDRHEERRGPPKLSVATRDDARVSLAGWRATDQVLAALMPQDGEPNEA
jgi:hypothetical protein